MSTSPTEHTYDLTRMLTAAADLTGDLRGAYTVHVNEDSITAQGTRGAFRDLTKRIDAHRSDEIAGDQRRYIQWEATVKTVAGWVDLVLIEENF